MTGNFTICVGTVGSGAWLSPAGQMAPNRETGAVHCRHVIAP